MHFRKTLFFILATSLMLGGLACQPTVKKPTKLPYLGHRDVVNGDTMYHTVPNFTFFDQNGKTITPQSFKDKAYIVDYFFTTCPTICPKVKQQELRIAEHFKNEDRLKFLSVSIDPIYDTIPRLRWYADKLDINGEQWHLVTGDKEEIYRISEDFFHVAKEDKSAPGGYNHDGNLVLVDKNRHIRAFVNALEPEKIDRFIEQVELLLAE